MSNDIRIVIEGTNHADSAFRAVNDDLDRLKVKSKAAGVELEGLADNFEKVGRKGGTAGGKRAGDSFFEGFTSTLKPGLIGAAIVAAVTLAPGVLLAATGIAGLGVGIVGQLSDPAVGSAAKRVGHDIMEELSADTRPFKEPLIDAIHTLGDDAKSVLHSIDFASLARELQPLASGFGGLFDRMMPGLNKMFESSGPVINRLATDLPMLGDALSDMFDMISRGGTGAAESIHLFVALLAGLALGIGAVVLVGSKLVEWTVSIGEKFSWWAAVLTNGVPVLGRWANGLHEMFAEVRGAAVDTVTAGRAFHQLGEDAQLSASDISTLTDKLSEVGDATSDLAAKWTAKLFGEMMNLDQATLHWHESLTNLNDTLDKNGLAIDRRTHLLADNTKAGEQNLAAILAAVQANEQQYQAMVASGISSTDAAKAYDNNTAALERQLHAAGYTAAQVDDLIGKYRNVPDKVNTALAVQGLTEAINNLGALEAAIHGIDGREFGFTITEKHVYESDYISHSRGEHASGGIAGGLISMNEHGWEAVHLPQGSTVIPHGASQALLDNTLSRPRGGDGAKSELTLKFEGSSNNWLLGALREAARHNEFRIYDSTGGQSAIY